MLYLRPRPRRFPTPIHLSSIRHLRSFSTRAFHSPAFIKRPTRPSRSNGRHPLSTTFLPQEAWKRRLESVWRRISAPGRRKLALRAAAAARDVPKPLWDIPIPAAAGPARAATRARTVPSDDGGPAWLAGAATVLSYNAVRRIPGHATTTTKNDVQPAATSATIHYGFVCACACTPVSDTFSVWSGSPTGAGARTTSAEPAPALRTVRRPSKAGALPLSRTGSTNGGQQCPVCSTSRTCALLSKQRSFSAYQRTPVVRIAA